MNTGTPICAGCGHSVSEDDRYCCACGKSLEGNIVSHKTESTGLCRSYGMPGRHKCYKCTVCGYEWKSDLPADKNRYCPKCGEPSQSVNRFRIISILMK